MQNLSLLEVLSLDRKILEKPPNWNLPVQEELFSPFSALKFLPDSSVVFSKNYYF
jgi:hypothetical protein